MLKRVSLFLAGILVIAIAAQAPGLQAGEGAYWSVVVASEATVQHGDNAVTESLVTGSVVATGDRLTTETGGTVVLARGDDLVTMEENSQIAITDPQPVSSTLIDQPYGQVGYTVTKKQTPHFVVTTPYLAAVVKGTSFTVRADATESSVAVSEGKVEVKDPKSGETAQVAAGDIGTVAGKSPGSIDVAKVSAAPNGAAASSANSTGQGANQSSANGSGSSAGNSGNGNGNGNGNAGGNGNGNAGGNGNGNAGGNGNGNAGGNGNGNAGGNGNGNGGGNGNGNGGGNGNGNGGGNNGN